MDWREALRSRATGLAGGRVYWTTRPQGSAYPALVFTVASDDRPQHLKGYSLAPGRVQVDCFGETVADAWDLADSAITTLVPAATANGHDFSRADVTIGPRDLTERVGNTTIYRVSFDLTIHHTEEVS